ncbi:MAG: PTS sugar transporter subunit IIA [Eubacteriaceae bacterium]|jgi:PTS system galactitol-specific IIA component|nr:PTS sugar transporter subunit IIA [Eubacteriaceae bacterium]
MEIIKATEDYLFLKLKGGDMTTVLREMAQTLYKEGFVEETYEQAVVDREKVFPTGLPILPYGVAIPHTDSIHVKKRGLAVGILKEKASFTLMSSDTEQIEASIVFMLAIKDQTEQVDFLSALIALCQNDAYLKTIFEGSDVNQIDEILHQLMQ